MARLCEQNVCIEFPGAINGCKFDGEHQQWRRASSMKAVDFIVEFQKNILFVELKMLAGPDSRAATRTTGLHLKFRDTWLHEWAQGGAVRDKPVYYFVLLCGATICKSNLSAMTDRLRQYIPVLGPDGKPWKHPLVQDCHVMDTQTWDKHMPYPISHLAG